MVVCNELRSHSVQAAFLAAFQPRFTFKRVPHAKHDPVHQHSSIDILLLRLRRAQPQAQPPPAGQPDTLNPEA